MRLAGRGRAIAGGRSGVALGTLAFACACGLLPAGPVCADTLVLDTGERLEGTVVSDEGATVVFDSLGLGRVNVPRERVATVEKTVPKAVQPAEQPPAAPEAPDAAVVPQPKVEDRTASELPQARPAAAAAPPEKQEDLFRLWIDQGVRYQIVQPVRIPMPFYEGAEIVREEVRVTGRVGIRASFDAAGFEASRGMPDLPADTATRTFRVYTTGDLSPTSSYAVQMGVIDGDWYLHQANIRWRDVRRLGNVTFGYLTVPQTLENLLPFGGSTFMEPGLPVLAFAPGNRMGVQTDRASDDGRSTLTLGIFSVGQNPGLNFGDETQSLLRPTARVTTMPYLSGDGTSNRSLLHLGLSAAYLVAEDSGIRYRARPESFTAPFLVDTGDIAARNALFLGTEIAWMAGPFTLQSEVVLNRVARGNEANYFAGADVAASWMLSGEQPAYNRTVGVPQRVIALKDFSPKNGTWGAWQLGLRLSYLDLNDGEVRGGRMVSGTAGLNWWWNRYFRWQLNYIYAVTEGGVSPGDLQILQGRAQLMY